MRYIKAEIIIVLFLLIASNTLSQNNIEGELPQYLFKSFSKGNVLFKNKEVESAPMNYNTVTENIVFEKNGELLDMINLHLIDTIYIQDSRFIPVGKAFYEVIATSPIPLFIQHKGKLFPPGKSVGYGGTSDLAATNDLANIEMSGMNYNLPLSTDFKVEITPVYWMIKDGEMVSFSSVRQLRNLFPEKKSEIKSFIKKGRLKLERKEDLVKIIRFCGGGIE